jgi:hypothetical protein
MWSFAMIFLHSCSTTRAAVFLARLCTLSEPAVRQRLREWRVDAADKRGKHRLHLEVSTCFAPLLAWMLRLWPAPYLALAVDATTLGDRLVVLVVSLLYRGCALPVAWHVRAGNTPGAWQTEWTRLLTLLAPAVPAEREVIVLADRGLYARWLFQHIVSLHWHPFLRINQGAKFCPQQTGIWVWLGALVPHCRCTWQGAGQAFISPTCRLTCTLVACWDERSQEPWFILTDLAPKHSSPAWYALRMWIEHGFKCLKSGGWQWQQTRTTDPERAERVWLALAVATLWVVAVGAEAEIPSAPSPESAAVLPDTTGPLSPRRLSPFRRGLIELLVQALTAQPLVHPTRLVPEPWPVSYI